MEIKRLRLFIYDEEKKKSFYYRLFEFLRDSSLKDYVIDKGYDNGYNIQILIREKQSFEEVISFFESYVPVRQLPLRERRLQELVICKLMNMEEINMDSDEMMIEDEGVYIVDHISIAKLEDKYKMQFKDIWSILLKRQQFLNIFIPKLTNLESVYLYLLLLCCITADSYPTGISDGAISFRSNYEYYMKQLELLDLDETNKEKIKKFMIEKTEQDQEDEKNLIELFFESDKILSDPIVLEYKRYLEFSRQLITKNFDQNLYYNQNLYTASDFFDRVKEPSDFHNRFYRIPKIIQLYTNRDFIVHRYILSLLYELFPLGNFSNRTKQKVIGHTANIIESQTNRNIKEAVDSWER